MRELKDYKIGDLAKLAGVSKRTIDYYTNLGLLKPIRLDNNYRYFSGESLVKLNLIREMKNSRFTLEEIKEHLDLIYDNSENVNKVEGETKAFSTGSIKDHLSHMQSQLLLLQPIVNTVDQNSVEHTTVITKQFLFESLVFIQELMVLIKELGHVL
ncbi:MAG: MerR family transcriptional regulator [Firmicutes bacterium HGW-Firmicutes-15]|nr:MAG: MerR family transcriptional regulator [Firmicutes bacterium HGW-Firmicutes-15]